MALELLKKFSHQVRVPGVGDKIYKDECVFSFDTPESETGLYVCLNSFLGFGKKHVMQYHKRTGNSVFLHLKTIKHEVVSEKQQCEKPVTRLAIGVEGGFIPDGKKYEYKYVNSVVVLPGFEEIRLPSPELPDWLRLPVEVILASDSASQVEEAKALSGTWDGEKRKVSKYAATLVQLNNGVKIPPRGWKCELCDKVENLWLNLTDGGIFCGRRFFDGSGGNNHALEHFKRTNYPLAVKLGTITPDGADVFSYDEDDMVEDPLLSQHLAHFGINITHMEKTEKSMIELEIDMNQRICEWVTIQESGSELVPVHGPGYTGLVNLGNSCYLNSIMQIIYSIPEFQERYYKQTSEIFAAAPPDPTTDFNVQMAKLSYGLLSGDYCSPSPSESGVEPSNWIQPGIKPTMFKMLIGKGHPEFSTKRQQDAQEFFLHLINLLERNNRNHFNPANCFKYQEEDRTQCMESGKVKYIHNTQYTLRLPIPLDRATNKEEVDAYAAKKKQAEESGLKLDPNEVIRANIPLSACIEAYLAHKIVPDFYSSALGIKTSALKTQRMATFPDFLMIQLDKFAFDDGWIPKKLDVSIDIPNELDLECVRGSGLQPGEEELPEEASQPSAVQAIDQNLVKQVAEMGFPIEACQKAVYYAGSEGIEAITSWLMEHMNDPDFAEPLSILSSSGDSTFEPNEEAVHMIISMGFSHEQACKALRATDNNVERAADWIFSHLEEINEETGMDVDQSLPPQPQAIFPDGIPKYRLMGFVSHMGSSTMVGHYVCHIYKEGRWIIYNDEKVAVSENPPKGLAYLYVYQRISTDNKHAI